METVQLGKPIIVLMIAFGSVLALLHFFDSKTGIAGYEHVAESSRSSNLQTVQLCVVVRGVKELKEGDTNMVNVSSETCHNGTGNNFVQAAFELARWARSHATEITALQRDISHAACDIATRRTSQPFEVVSQMDSISTILAEQSLPFQRIFDYFEELVTLALTAENRLSIVEQLYGKCLCQRNPSWKFVPWGAWCARKQWDPKNPKVRKPPCNTRVADYLAQTLFNGCSVADFGAGVGMYKKRMLSSALGKPKVMTPFDGSIGIDEVTNGFVKYANLAKPLRLRVDAPVFDWVMSVEVAEHIPQNSETTFLKNLVRRAARGVVISWAVPGQGGVGHVNERTNAYVVRRFSQLGFVLDAEETNKCRKLKRGTLSHTLHVFRRKPAFLRREQLLWDPLNERLVRNKSNSA